MDTDHTPRVPDYAWLDNDTLMVRGITPEEIRHRVNTAVTELGDDEITVEAGDYMPQNLIATPCPGRCDCDGTHYEPDAPGLRGARFRGRIMPAD